MLTEKETVALAVVPEQDVSLADRDLSLMMSKSITSLYCKVLMKPEQNRWEERCGCCAAAAGLPAHLGLHETLPSPWNVRFRLRLSAQAESRYWLSSSCSSFCNIPIGAVRTLLLRVECWSDSGDGVKVTDVRNRHLLFMHILKRPTAPFSAFQSKRSDTESLFVYLPKLKFHRENQTVLYIQATTILFY